MCFKSPGHQRKVLFLVPASVKSIADLKHALKEYLKGLGMPVPVAIQLSVDGYEAIDSTVSVETILYMLILPLFFYCSAD